MASEFDYRDPGQDADYCDNHSDPPPDFDCAHCGTRCATKEEDSWPYCSPICLEEAERGPRDAREAWLDGD